MPNAKANRLHEREARRMAALSPFPADRKHFLAIAENARARAEIHEARDSGSTASPPVDSATPPPAPDQSKAGRSSWLSRLMRKRS